MLNPTLSYLASNANLARTPVYRATFARAGVVVGRFSTDKICDYLTEVLADGPSLLLRFSETVTSPPTTAAADSSGNGLNGTYVGSPTLGVPGAITGSSKTAVTLNGTTQYVTVADNGLLDPGDTFTLKFRIKPAVITGVNTILYKGAGSYVVYLSSGFIVLFKDGVGQICLSTITLAVGVWADVAITKSGAASAKIYINGVDVTGAVTNQTIVATSSPLYIGSYGVASALFSGSLQDVQVLSAALSAARIAAQYNAGLRGQYLSDWKPYLELPRGIASFVEPDHGRATVGSIVLTITDVDGYFTDFISGDGIGNDVVTFEAGFDDIQGEEFQEFGKGIVEGCRMTANHAAYEVTARDPQALTNKQVFAVAASKLTVALTDVATSLVVADSSGFDPAGYARIEGEWIQYTGITSGVQPANQTWKSIAFGGTYSLFVGVAQDGSVATSPDGVNWTSQVAPEANSWNRVIWARELALFAAVASSGTNRVMTSPDGLVWTARAAAAANSWQDVAWSASLTLLTAVSSTGSGNRIMTSPDGVTWTSRTAYVGGNTIAWDEDNEVFSTINESSTDGTAWTDRTAVQNLRSICYSDGLNLFVGVGEDGLIATSVDGSAWVRRSPPSALAGTLTFMGVCWSPGLSLLVACGNQSIAGAGQFAIIVTSSDGIAWTKQTFTFQSGSATRVLNSVVWSPGLSLFVAVGGGGLSVDCVESSDGTTWTEHSMAGGVISGQTACVEWSPSLGLFVALSSGGSHTSTDGVSWSRSTDADVGSSVTSLAWSPSLALFVAVSSSGNRIITSANGTAWTVRTPAESNAMRGVAWSADLTLFVACSSDGTHRVQTSADGINWSNQTTVLDAWQCVAWSPSAELGTFVLGALASGAGGSYRPSTSTDGTTWNTPIRAAEPNTWNRVRWANALSLFVAVASSGTNRVSTSPDAINWTPRSASQANSWQDLVWAQPLTLLVAVASDGTNRVMTSPDGINWTNRTSGAQSAWKAIAWSDLIFASLASSAYPDLAQTSANGTTWVSSASRITGLTRGVDIAPSFTIAAAHAVGASVGEVLRFTGHPIDLTEGWLTDAGKRGASVDPALVNTAALALLKIDIGVDIQMDILADKPANLKTWIETEINAPLGLYPSMSGAWSLTRIAGPGVAVATIDHSNIVTPKNSPPLIGFDRNYQSVLNVISFDHDYDLISGTFLSTGKEYVDQASIDKYGRKPLPPIQSKGIKSTLPGTLDLLQVIADNLLERYADGAPLVPVRIFLQDNLIEPGDIVSVTSALLPDPDTGLRGVTGALMEVVEREMVFAEAHVNLKLQWTGY